MNIKTIPTRYKFIVLLCLLALLLYLFMPQTKSQEKDLSQYEATSIIVTSPLNSKMQSLRINKGDELAPNTLLLSLNTDEYQAEIALAKTNIELIKAGKKPEGTATSLSIKDAIAEKEALFLNAQTNEAASSQEYTYWTNELAKIQFQLRKSGLKEPEKAELTIKRDNALLMQEGAKEKLEKARQVSLEAEKNLNDFKRAQDSLQASYMNMSLWQQKIAEAEYFIQLSDLYSTSKIIILEVYVNENDEVVKGQKLYKYALLPE